MFNSLHTPEYMHVGLRMFHTLQIGLHNLNFLRYIGPIIGQTSEDAENPPIIARIKQE